MELEASRSHRYPVGPATKNRPENRKEATWGVETERKGETEGYRCIGDRAVNDAVDAARRKIPSITRIFFPKIFPLPSIFLENDATLFPFEIPCCSSINSIYQLSHR